jgi:hypothetical protein
MLTANLLKEESSLQVLQEMQEGINLSEGFLSATCGAIKVAKSTWWLINFLLLG